jgi:hypothetical protein
MAGGPTYVGLYERVARARYDGKQTDDKSGGSLLVRGPLAASVMFALAVLSVV